MIPYTYSSMTHNYRAGLFDCCQESKLCCYSCFCYPCARSQAWADVRNQRKTCCHCFSHGIFIRSNIRMARGIQQDFASDCCIYLFCPCCALVQDIREIRYLKEEILESVQSGEPFIHYVLTEHKEYNDYKTESAFIPNVVISAEKSSKEKKDYFAMTNNNRVGYLPQLQIAHSQKIFPAYPPLDENDQNQTQNKVTNQPNHPILNTNHKTEANQANQRPSENQILAPKNNSEDIQPSREDISTPEKESIIFDESPIKTAKISNPSPIDTPRTKRRRQTQNDVKAIVDQLPNIIPNNSENQDETSIDLDVSTQSSLIHTSDFQSQIQTPTKASRIIQNLNSTTPHKKRRTTSVNLTFHENASTISPKPSIISPPTQTNQVKSPRTVLPSNKVLNNDNLGLHHSTKDGK